MGSLVLLGMWCHMTGRFVPDASRQCDGLIFTGQKVHGVSADTVRVLSAWSVWPSWSVPAFYAIISGSPTSYFLCACYLTILSIVKIIWGQWEINEWLQSTGGKILSGENQKTKTWPFQRINSGLQSGRPATNCLGISADCQSIFGFELWQGPSASHICHVLPSLDKNRVDGMSKTSYSTQDHQCESSVFHLPTTHSVHIRGTSILLIRLKTATKCGKEAQHNTICTSTYCTSVCKKDLIRQCEMKMHKTV